MERLTTVKSHRGRLDVLFTQLDFRPDSPSIVSHLIEEQYESCVTIDALHQIESLLNEVSRRHSIALWIVRSIFV
jgi:hypothetical protein